MVRFVMTVMDDASVLHLLLQASAHEEVVDIGDQGGVPRLVNAGEVDVVLVPRLKQVQLVHCFLDSVCVISSSQEVSIYVPCPNNGLTASPLYGVLDDAESLNQLRVLLAQGLGVAGKITVY